MRSCTIIVLTHMYVARMLMARLTCTLLVVNPNVHRLLCVGDELSVYVVVTEKYNLLIVGGPHENSLSQRYLDRTAVSHTRGQLADVSLFTLSVL